MFKTDKLIIKFIWEHKGQKITKTVSTDNKTHYKVIDIKTIWLTLFLIYTDRLNGSKDGLGTKSVISEMTLQMRLKS